MSVRKFYGFYPERLFKVFVQVLSKVFEAVIHEQLSDYFSSNNLFSGQQYGFRKNSSTELAALELIDRLLAQLKNHMIPIHFYMI